MNLFVGYIESVWPSIINEYTLEVLYMRSFVRTERWLFPLLRSLHSVFGNDYIKEKQKEIVILFCCNNLRIYHMVDHSEWRIIGWSVIAIDRNCSSEHSIYELLLSLQFMVGLNTSSFVLKWYILTRQTICSYYFEIYISERSIVALIYPGRHVIWSAQRKSWFSEHRYTT